MTATAIRATGLRKSYGDTLVLDGIDLEVATGSVFALLGPNGAGKTTTVHMLTTMLTPDAGEVEVGGHDLRTDPEGVRSEIGVTGQFSAVDNLLTGQENLQLMADLNHLPREEGRRRIADLLDRFDLVEVGRPDGRDLLRRREAPARPGDDARRRSADRLPRRADDRARPARAPHDVGHRSSPRGRRHHDLPDHPVPRGGR